LCVCVRRLLSLTEEERETNTTDSIQILSASLYYLFACLFLAFVCLV
jgi:hypothetical protein